MTKWLNGWTKDNNRILRINISCRAIKTLNTLWQHVYEQWTAEKKITRRNMRTYMYLKHDHITNMYVHHLLVHEPAYFDCCIYSIEWCSFPTPNNTINQIRINNKRLERQRKQRKKHTYSSAQRTTQRQAYKTWQKHAPNQCIYRHFI